MFKRNLAVSDDNVGTPAVATPSTNSMTPLTPAVTTPSSAMLPPLTPAVNTPSSDALGSMTPTTYQTGGGQAEYPADDDDGLNAVAAADEEEGAENEDDVIKRIAMQNPFTPSNVYSVGNKLMNWGETVAQSPLDNATPAVSTVVGTASEDIKERIAAYKTKLGASSPLIHNVVATANLGVSLDLKKIALTARNAEYNPRRFAAVVMRIREPKSTALVFKSGKLVVTGTKSEKDAKHAARKFGRIIMKVGYPDAKFKEFHVENLVSTFAVPFPIHIEQLYRDLPPERHSQYEPEVFPGLIYKAPTGTLLIFVSGKCVMIGMKTQDDIDKAFLDIIPRLDSHRKK